MNWIRKIVFIIISGSYTLVAMAQVDSSRLADLEDQVAALERKVNSMNPGLSSFLLTGFTNLTYHQDLNDIRTSRFDHAGFSPITLWRPTEKTIF